MSSPATVLVIDDDADFRSLVREELGRAGYGVTEASGGHEGVAMLRQTDVDVVLLDVQMPGLNGREVLREARNLGVRSEVVVMTAYPKLEIAMECLRAGVFDLLEKPFPPKSLLATLGHAVERGRLYRTTALYRATADIFAARNPQDLPQVIVETAMRALEADDASLMLPDAAGSLTIAYSHGLPELVRKATRVRLGEGISGRVAQDRVPALLIGSPAGMPRFAGVRGDPERVRSSNVYPLAAGEQLAGVLNVNRAQSRKPFREADLELASVFASQALLALENVNLLRRLIHAERLAFVGRLAADLSHEVNNPTSFIIANLQYIAENVEHIGPQADELRQSAVDALEGAQRIRRVVQDRRGMLRGDEPMRVPVDLNSPVRFALRMTARQLEGVQVESSLAGDVTVLGDEGARAGVPEPAGQRGAGARREARTARGRRHRAARRAGARHRLGQRPRHPAARSGAHLRRVLHHQARRGGVGIGPVHLARDRPAARRGAVGGVGGGPRLALHPHAPGRAARALTRGLSGRCAAAPRCAPARGRAAPRPDPADTYR